MRIAAAALAVAAVTVMLAATATARPAADFVICSQIKNGPTTSWTLSIPGRGSQTLSGSTWTVIAVNGIPCGKATSIARTLLKAWPATLKTSTHQIKPPLAGFDICSSEPRNGQISCYDIKHDKNVTVVESGKYTLAQIKQLAATGALSH